MEMFIFGFGSATILFLSIFIYYIVPYYDGKLAQYEKFDDIPNDPCGNSNIKSNFFDYM